jgi:hypothetical protein
MHEPPCDKRRRTGTYLENDPEQRAGSYEPQIGALVMTGAEPASLVGQDVMTRGGNAGWWIPRPFPSNAVTLDHAAHTRHAGE